MRRPDRGRPPSAHPGTGLADKRVNLVNPRREFFHATPTEVKALLSELAGDLLHFGDFPDAP